MVIIIFPVAISFLAWGYLNWIFTGDFFSFLAVVPHAVSLAPGPAVRDTVGLSQLLFVYIIIKCVRGGAKATAQVWEGAHGLEWAVPSPAPHHTFETPPVIAGGEQH